MQTILQNQLRGTATELVRFLNAQLPGIGGDSWWSSHVNPLFPAIRSGHRLFQQPSPGKQFPSNKFLIAHFTL